MGAVRADRELELEQELVRRLAFGVVRAPVLAADLAELARPVGQRAASRRCRAATRRRRARTDRSGRRRTSAARTDSRPTRRSRTRPAGRPAARGGSRSSSDAPDERAVDRPPQRPPPQGGVDAEERRREPCRITSSTTPGGVVPVRVRDAEVDVGRLGEVLVAAQMADVAEVAALAATGRRRRSRRGTPGRSPRGTSTGSGSAARPRCRRR